MTLLEQSFQGGLAIWRSDTREIYVLRRDGNTWTRHADTWSPDEKMAREVDALGGEPASAVHVGDDAILDVEGAQKAGLRAVQVVGRGPEAGGARADRTITCLGELPAAIASLEAA